LAKTSRRHRAQLYVEQLIDRIVPSWLVTDFAQPPVQFSLSGNGFSRTLPGVLTTNAMSDNEPNNHGWSAIIPNGATPLGEPSDQDWDTLEDEFPGWVFEEKPEDMGLAQGSLVIKDYEAFAGMVVGSAGSDTIPGSTLDWPAVGANIVGKPILIK
jgi:hypothetical protein